MADAVFKRSRNCNFLLCTVFLLLFNNIRCQSTTAVTDSKSAMNVTSSAIVSDSNMSSALINISPTSTSYTNTIGNYISLSESDIITTQINSSMVVSSIPLISNSEFVSVVSSMTVPPILSTETLHTSNTMDLSIGITSTTDDVFSTNVVNSWNNTIAASTINFTSQISENLSATTINWTASMSIVSATSSQFNLSETSVFTTESISETISTYPNIEETSTSSDMSTSPTVYTSSSLISTTISSISSSSSASSSSVSPNTTIPTISPTTESSTMTSSGSIVPTSSVSLTTPPTPSTTPRPTTPNPTAGLPSTVRPEIDENTVFKVNTRVIIYTCISDNHELKILIWDILKGVDGFKDVIIIKNTCKEQRRKKRDNSEKIVDTQIIIEAKTARENETTVLDGIINAFTQSLNVSLENATNFRSDAFATFSDICRSSICDQYQGYNCSSVENAPQCTSICNNIKCSEHGQCHIIVTSIGNYGTQCVCDSEEFYKYEGDQCQTKRMKWELAVAIAGGAGGAIILILLFIICLCCCCKNKDDKYIYNDRRTSYEPMSDVLNRPAYYRNEGIKSQAGFTNFGYNDESYHDDIDVRPLRQTNGQSWNPEASKDTYAKIQEKLEQEKSFQIKRPQLSTTTKRQSDTGEAATGF